MLEGLLENWLTFLMKIKYSAFLFEIIFLKKITACLYKFVKESFQFKRKILKSAFSNKHLKLIMSDEDSYFSHSIPFSYGDKAGGYIKQFFLPIGKYLKKNL